MFHAVGDAGPDAYGVRGGHTAAAQDLSHISLERGRLQEASERMLRVTEELEGVQRKRAERDPIWAAQTPKRKGTCGFQCNLHAHKWLFIVGAGRCAPTFEFLPRMQGFAPV
eukprot:176884-Prorocentrum_minimum.AAC.1